MPPSTDAAPGCRRPTLATALVLLAWTRLALAVCGDGVLDPGESCDDGNLVAGDCCEATCVAEPAGAPCADDRNPCSLDECDGAGVCTHPTGGNAACDDGDGCTTDDRCDAGVCAGTPVPDACIDPVLCRRARATAPIFRFAVGVDDGSTLFVSQLGRPRDLCLPASTTGAPPLDPATVLVSSRVVSTPVAARWRVTDRFGVLEIETRGAERLLAASATSATPPPPAPPPPGSANHYACRRAPPAAGERAAGGRGHGRRRARQPGGHALAPAPSLPSGGRRDAEDGDAAPARHARLLRRADERAIDARAGGDPSGGEPAPHGGLEAFRERELCVPAAVERLSTPPCETSRDECGLPCCRDFGGQHPECTYDPLLPYPRYRGCAGPTVLVDRTHANFHQVTPESTRNPGRFWGFAKLAVRDGYVVRDSTTPFDVLLPANPAAILVLANPRALRGPVAVPPADVATLLAWVEQGGSLLVSIDHPPFDRTVDLLGALGLEQIGKGVRQFTFTIANGGLNAASPIAAGVGEVTTFTGTAFRVAAAPPAQATYEPVLTFPPNSPNDADGWLQGIAIQFGAGRVYVSGESGGLTAQSSFGMHETPDNERYVRNILHWLR